MKKRNLVNLLVVAVMTMMFVWGINTDVYASTEMETEEEKTSWNYGRFAQIVDGVIITLLDERLSYEGGELKYDEKLITSESLQIVITSTDGRVWIADSGSSLYTWSSEKPIMLKIAENITKVYSKRGYFDGYGDSEGNKKTLDEIDVRQIEVTVFTENEPTTETIPLIIGYYNYAESIHSDGEVTEIYDSNGNKVDEFSWVGKKKINYKGIIFKNVQSVSYNYIGNLAICQKIGKKIQCFIVDHVTLKRTLIIKKRKKNSLEIDSNGFAVAFVKNKNNKKDIRYR